MNSFSSASQMREPLPRAINGGSPPTERNARTGELTPPGIMLSARCCRRRDCSTFRVVVGGIVASSTAEADLNRCGRTQALLYQRRYLQIYRKFIVSPSFCNIAAIL